MNADTLAFFNRQLAALLTDGVPLEGALREIAHDLKGPVAAEITALEASLAQGVPFHEALAARRLPALYVQLVRAGTAAQNLPAALTAAADHFESSARLTRRIRSALFYPSLVLSLGLLVSLSASVTIQPLTEQVFSMSGLATEQPVAIQFLTRVPAAFAVLFTLALLLMLVKQLRRIWVSRLPGFHDAALARLASTLQLLLSNGCPLPAAVSLVQGLEGGSRLAPDLARWQAQLQRGSAKLSDVIEAQSASRAVPPMFRWLVVSGGDRLHEGFGRAARHYRDRAEHRLSLLVNGIVPVALIGIGVILFINFIPVFTNLIQWIDFLGGGLD